MLADSPVHPVLLATDLDAAREFYHTKLGLPILADRGEIGIEVRLRRRNQAHHHHEHDRNG